MTHPHAEGGTLLCSVLLPSGLRARMRVCVCVCDADALPRRRSEGGGGGGGEERLGDRVSRDGTGGALPWMIARLRTSLRRSVCL